MVEILIFLNVVLPQNEKERKKEKKRKKAYSRSDFNERHLLQKCHRMLQDSFTKKILIPLTKRKS